MKAVFAMVALSMTVSGCASPSVQAVSAADVRLSASVADQVRRCYRNPRIPSSGRRIVTRLLVRYAPDGTLAGVPFLVSQQSITPDNQAYAGRMAEAAKQAVVRCSPVSLPGEQGRARASEFYLTFSPQLAA
ncbi:MAG TPA: hypothetical protein VF605_12240 [Allosphingosinicella sp.]|jgi:hypothetical protein